RHADGAVRRAQGRRRLRGPDAQESRQLRGAAADRAVESSHLHGRALRAAADRPAAVHPLRRQDPRAARRADARGAAPRLLRRQLLARRRQQRYLGAGAAAGRLMLSRVADAIYWMGRYVERAENITRLLLVTEDFSTETQGLEETVAQAAWKDLLAILPTAQLTRPVSTFAPLSLPYLTSFFLDGDNGYSVHFSLRKARENARAVREALTIEAFMSINEIFHAVEAAARKGLTDLPGLRDALASTHKGIFSVIGAIDSTFTRDEGWHFLKLGESVERVYRAALILRARLPALLAAEPRTDVPLYYSQ